MKRLRVCVVTALGSFASFVVAPLVAQTSVIDVGTLGFGSSYLLAVNNRNEAVGYSEVSGLDTNRAMLWRDGQLIDLGVLPGLDLSVAADINERGQIVGFSSEFQYSRPRAVLWQEGQAIDITPAEYESCRALAINNRGDIVGQCHSVPVLWRGGTVIPLSMLPGTRFGAAIDINDAGVIVGTLSTAANGIPVRWTDGTPEALALPAGALGGYAAAINERGQIAGYVQNPGFYDPVLWERGEVAPLAGAWGLVFGYAWGLNNRGDVAVHAFTGPITEYGGHIWRGGTFHRLEPTGSLNDINERGVAVGRVLIEGTAEAHGAVWPKASTLVAVHGGVR